MSEYKELLKIWTTVYKHNSHGNKIRKDVYNKLNVIWNNFSVDERQEILRGYNMID